MEYMMVEITAAASTIGFLILWFWIVHRELHEKKKMVESARRQFAASRREELRVADTDGGKAREVCTRSWDIYHQAVLHYNRSLKRIGVRFPGFLMGFRRLPENGNQEG